MHVGENLTAEQVSWGEKLIHCSKSKVPPKGLFNTTRLQVARVLTLQHLKQNNLPTATMCSCSYCFFRYVLIASYKLFWQHWFFQGKLGELTPIHARVTWWDPRLHSDQIRRRGEENVGGAIHFNEEVTLLTFILAIGLAVLWKSWWKHKHVMHRKKTNLMSDSLPRPWAAFSRLSIDFTLGLQLHCAGLR